MMLLQAGQIGLTRNVIFPGLPPSLVAGGTLWFDASDPATLYTPAWPAGGGSLVSSSGQEIGAAVNKVNSGNGMFAASSPRPVYTTGALNGYSVAVLDNIGSGGTPMFVTTTTAAATVAASSFVTTTIKNIVVAVKVDSADADTGTAYTNRMIVGEGAGYFGLHVSDPGGGVNLKAHAFNYSGGIQEATLTFPKSTWVVLTFSHQAGNVRVRLNGGTWATIASGTTDSLAQPLQIGANGFVTLVDMEIVQMMVMNTTQTDTTLAYCEQWIANEMGLTPWW